MVGEYSLQEGTWNSGVPVQSIAITGDPSFSIFFQNLLSDGTVIVVQEAVYTSTTSSNIGLVRFPTAANSLKVNFITTQILH